jgi:hypothetical protein
VDGGHDGSHGRDTGAGNGKRSKNGEHGEAFPVKGGPPSEGYRVPWLDSMRLHCG